MRLEQSQSEKIQTEGFTTGDFYVMTPPTKNAKTNISPSIEM